MKKCWTLCWHTSEAKRWVQVVSFPVLKEMLWRRMWDAYSHGSGRRTVGSNTQRRQQSATLVFDYWGRRAQRSTGCDLCSNLHRVKKIFCQINCIILLEVIGVECPLLNKKKPEGFWSIKQYLKFKCHDEFKLISTFTSLLWHKTMFYWKHLQ